MKRIKPFMRNRCGHGICKDSKCIEYSHYNPHFLGIKVPKKLANIFYNIEYWLINLEFPEVFY